MVEKASYLTVYIIDDDASVRQALVRLLRSAGFNVTAFSSVQELLDYPEMIPNSCVIADIRMPGVSALELPALLQSGGWQIPVIYLTAQDTEETRTAAKQAGAAAFFRKPVDDQALIDAIAWVVREE